MANYQFPPLKNEKKFEEFVLISATQKEKA